MKKLYLMLVLVSVFWNLQAQNIGIGTLTPHASAQLDVTSSNRGVLVPRISLTNIFLATPVTGPAAGLLIWNTNQATTNGQGVGFYFWTGSQWQKLSSAADGWSITGNNGTDTAVNFIGTVNNVGLMFRVANQKAGGIFPFGGNTFLGISAGRFLKYDSEAFTGDGNTFMGSEAGANQLDGRLNTFIGSRAGVQTQGGFANTFVGFQSGGGSNGGQNTALGIGSGASTTGSRNVSIGANTGGSLQAGYENVMIGYDVGSFLFDAANAPAYGNVWIGSNAATGNFGLEPKRISINNVIIGDSAAHKVNGAIANVFVGKRSGMNSRIGQFNVFVGDSSGINNTNGQLNTYIGSKARGSSISSINATAIGANAQAGADNVLVLGSINGVNGATNSVNVGIGTATPNRRLYIQDGAPSGVNSSGNSLLVLDKTGGPNYLSILNGNTFESGLLFGRAGSNQPPFDGGIFYNVSNTPGGMQFRNKGGLTRMIIHDNGNISMGVNNENYKLVVQDGTSSGVTASANSSVVLDKSGAPHYLSLLNSNFETGILFGIAGTTTPSANGGILYNSTNSFQGFQFRTGGNNTRMVVAGNGNIGMGTVSPDFRLHVVTSDAQNLGFREGIMVENTATGVSGSGLANTGEAAISFKNAGPEGTGSKQWIVGLNQNRNLTFSYGDQFDASANRMVLDSTGRLGIGISNPTFQLQLSTNSAAKPGTNSWTVSSDERLKKDMHPFEDGLEVLEKIAPIWFTYTGAENHPQEQFVGATAQAIQKVAPYMVTTLKEKSTVGDNLLGVDYGPLQFIMVNAIKEQQQVIHQQQTEIELLKKRLDALEKRK